MQSESYSSRAWWFTGAAVVVGLVGLRLLISKVTVQSTEISSALSPDGAGYAVLLDVPRDAHHAHSARVCLRRSTIPASGQSLCTSIAYLSGIAAGDRQLGIQLDWQSSTELAIRYREARAVYLYYPMFTWPYMGRRTSYRHTHSLTPIHVRLVRTAVAGNAVPAGPPHRS